MRPRCLEPRQPRRPRSMAGRPRHHHRGEAAMLRVSSRGEGIDDADTIEGAQEIVQGSRRAATRWTSSGPSRSERSLVARRGARDMVLAGVSRIPEERAARETLIPRRVFETRIIA
jgi:hypothetical protein